MKNIYEILPKKYLSKASNPNYDLHQFDLPFRCVVNAPSGSGKSNWLVNFIALCCEGKGTFDDIYLICRCSDEPLYNFLKEKSKKIYILEGINKTPNLDNFDKDLNHLVIWDDLLLEKHQQQIEAYYIRARKKNVSCIYLSQKFFSVPKMIRTNCNYFVILKIGSNRDINFIMSDYALQVSKETLLNMYEYATKEKFNALIIDIDTANKEKKFRKNFTEYLNPSDYE
jgi:hypothetical protein